MKEEVVSEEEATGEEEETVTEEVEEAGQEITTEAEQVEEDLMDLRDLTSCPDNQFRFKLISLGSDLQRIITYTCIILIGAARSTKMMNTPRKLF